MHNIMQHANMQTCKHSNTEQPSPGPLKPSARLLKLLHRHLRPPGPHPAIVAILPVLLVAVACCPFAQTYEYPRSPPVRWNRFVCIPRRVAPSSVPFEYLTSWLEQPSSSRSLQAILTAGNAPILYRASASLVAAWVQIRVVKTAELRYLRETDIRDAQENQISHKIWCSRSDPSSECRPALPGNPCGVSNPLPVLASCYANSFQRDCDRLPKPTNPSFLTPLPLDAHISNMQTHHLNPHRHPN